MAALEQIIDEARARAPAEKGKFRQALDNELEQPAPFTSLFAGEVSYEQFIS